MLHYDASPRLTHTHQNDPQTPQVARLVVAVVLQYLRRCVLQREAGRLEELIVWWFEASKAKVYDFYLRVLALVGEEQVLQSETGQTAIISFCAATLVRSRAHQIGHQDIKTRCCFKPRLGSNNFTLVVQKIAESD